jgi:hypothetical protein
VALVHKGVVADFAESVEEYGAVERILLLSLIEADGYTQVGSFLILGLRFSAPSYLLESLSP